MEYYLGTKEIMHHFPERASQIRRNNRLSACCPAQIPVSTGAGKFNSAWNEVSLSRFGHSHGDEVLCEEPGPLPLGHVDNVEG